MKSKHLIWVCIGFQAVYLAFAVVTGETYAYVQASVFNAAALIICAVVAKGD